MAVFTNVQLSQSLIPVTWASIPTTWATETRTWAGTAVGAWSNVTQS